MSAIGSILYEYHLVLQQRHAVLKCVDKAPLVQWFLPWQFKAPRKCGLYQNTLSKGVFKPKSNPPGRLMFLNVVTDAHEGANSTYIEHAWPIPFSIHQNIEHIKNTHVFPFLGVYFFGLGAKKQKQKLL